MGRVSVFFVVAACFIYNQASAPEPKYVSNLKTYYHDPYTKVYWCSVESASELDSKAKKIFERFLEEKDTNQAMSNTEWRRVYENNGPFESEEQLDSLNQELENPKDFMASLAMEMVLHNRDDYDKASKEFKEAFVSKENIKVSLFYHSDNDIFSGVVVAAVRKNMGAVFLVSRMD